jgi:hypothetical protein
VFPEQRTLYVTGVERRFKVALQVRLPNNEVLNHAYDGATNDDEVEENGAHEEPLNHCPTMKLTFWMGPIQPREETIVDPVAILTNAIDEGLETPVEEELDKNVTAKVLDPLGQTSKTVWGPL